MRILLTGATGFVGSAVLPRLVSRGHDVAILQEPGVDDWRIREHTRSVLTIEGDLAAPDRYAPAVRGFRPQAVAHLAWAGVAGSARNDPRQLENVTAAAHLLGLAHDAGAKHWVGLGSQAEYGPHSARLDERTPTRPTTLYGIAKLATCLATARLCEEHGIRHAWLRLFSSYGPKDHPAWMVPYLILELLRGKRPSLTAGEQLWDYVHVVDVAEAVYATLVSPSATGVMNLGSGRAVPIRRIVEQIRDLVDPSLPLGFGEIPYRSDQVMHLEADTTRLEESTGWTCRITLADGIKETVRWYREHLDQYQHD
jgi:nucleoside-diphosphate-sugar epimerase